ncbi:hypothetical protein KR009_006342 [Drosophila setifemur]|nr:hypothetical protein KR009_006342 [Drosophila setifemur]
MPTDQGINSYGGYYFGFCSLISHVLLAGITAAIVYKCLVLKLVHTAGHAFYCTIAFVFFMGEALLVRNSTKLESWLGPLNLNRLHAALGLLAFLVGVGGIAIKTLQKLDRKREDPNATVRHFRSNHGFYGIIGCVLLLGSVLTGLPLYFISCGNAFKLIHRFFGLAGFLALMVSQMFGYNTGFGRRQWKAHQQKLFKFFTFIATVTTVNYELRRFVRDVFTLAASGIFGTDEVEARDEL